MAMLTDHLAAVGCVAARRLARRSFLFLLAPRPLDLAPLDHIALVLLVGLGKNMSARPVGHEEQVLCSRRIGDGFHGRPAGLPIGPGGRPSI